MFQEDPTCPSMGWGDVRVQIPTVLPEMAFSALTLPLRIYKYSIWESPGSSTSCSSQESLWSCQRCGKVGAEVSGSTPARYSCVWCPLRGSGMVVQKDSKLSREFLMPGIDAGLTHIPSSHITGNETIIRDFFLGHGINTARLGCA